MFSFSFPPCWLFVCEGILFRQRNSNSSSNVLLYHSLKSLKNNNSLILFTPLTMVIPWSLDYWCLLWRHISRYAGTCAREKTEKKKETEQPKRNRWQLGTKITFVAITRNSRNSVIFFTPLTILTLLFVLAPHKQICWYMFSRNKEKRRSTQFVIRVVVSLIAAS